MALKKTKVQGIWSSRWTFLAAATGLVVSLGNFWTTPQEAAAQELMETLRCLKCQSQSIADSDAPMAGDMRHQVRIRVAAGESPDEIRSWLIQRYGDYVSYKPAVSATTWPLFAIPLLLIAVAGAILLRRFRKRA